MLSVQSLPPVRLARCAYVAAGMLFLGMVSSGHALDFAVSPGSIAWNSNTWVTCTVSGITPGSTVTLELHQDIDANGVLGAPDRLIRSFSLRDGATNALGSRVIPDDDDRSVDGSVTTSISYFGTGGSTPLWRSVGHYLWRASTISSGEAAAVFTIIQPTAPTWITGEVLDYPSSNAVAGAVVGLGLFADHMGPLPTVLSDTNGQFAIYLPDGYPTSNVAGVWSVAAGAMMADEGPDGDPFSAAPFMSDLSVGENALSNPLLVIDRHDFEAGDIYMYSGHVYDSASNALAGAWVEAENDNDDSDRWAIAVTDTNGFFEMPMPEGDLSFFTDNIVGNQRGLTPGWSERSLSGPASDIEIFCPAGEVLAKVALTEAGSGLPVPGAFVVFEGESSWNAEMAVQDGICEIVLLEGIYEAFVEDDEILRLGYLPKGVDDVDVTEPSPFTNLNFEVQSFVTLAGHVYDEQSNTLAFGEVQAFLPHSWDWQGDADANRQGYYEVAVPTGSYRVVAGDFDGFLAQAYEGYYEWEWDNGPAGDPVVVGASGASEIDFYMEAGAFIRGVVTNASGAPLHATVRIQEQTSDSFSTWWGQVRQTDTEGDGSYEILVPAGTNYRVRAESGGYLAEYYAGFYAYEANVATPVSTAPGSPANTIDFELDDPHWIEGRVHTSDTALEDVEVRVEWLRSEEDWWDTEFIGNGQSDSNGYYAIPCPPGSNFVVRASPDSSSFYVPESWSNSYDGADQTLVVVPPGGNATDIDFDLVQGGRIEGNVYELNGVDPHSGGRLTAASTDGETRFRDHNDDGEYEIVLPPGTYLVEFKDDDSWPDQLYDGVFMSQRDSAMAVTVEAAQVTGNIDFTMLAAVHIEGRVTHEGTPLGDIFVVADEVPDTNESWNVNFADGAETDGDGYYSLQVPPYAHYKVSARPETGYLLKQFWSNAVNQDATLLQLGDTDVSGIDFALTEGFRVEGHVTYEDDLPAEDVWVQADIMGPNGWPHSVDDGHTETDGFYSMTLPTGMTYAVSAGGDSSTWYWQHYYSNTAAIGDAQFLGGDAGQTISGIDIQLFPGFRIQGHVYMSDGVTPVDGPTAVANNLMGDTILSSHPGGSNGWYEVVAPAGVSLLVEGYCGGEYANEYYDNAYAISDATPVTGVPRSTTNIDFVLYGYYENSDADALYNREEDSRPDGIYVPGVDWSCYTNSDTDGDALDDGTERYYGTSPTQADTDGDSHTDYEEVEVLLTDPTNKLSNLSCVGVVPDASGGVRVTWSSVPHGVGYRIEMCPTLVAPTPQWEEVAGPISASLSNTTSTLLGGQTDTNAFYRIKAYRNAPW